MVCDYYGYGEDYFPHETYTLFVGRTPKGTCYLCKQDSGRDYDSHIVRTGRLHWGAHICNACELQYPNCSVFDYLSMAMPQEFITPEIGEWGKLHPSNPRHRETNTF